MGNISAILGGDFYPPEPIKTPIVKPARDQFIQAMLDAGLEPPLSIKADGNFHRFSTGDGKNTNGFYKIFGDFEGAYFGCWKADIKQGFHADIGRPYTAKENAEHQARMAEAKAINEADKLKSQALAANTVSTIWNNAADAITHAYLTKKGVVSHGLKVTGDGRLIIPMLDIDGNLQSLQYISVDGEKRYHSGGATNGAFLTLGTPQDVIYICEGYATGCTVYEATGAFTVIAFSASNLVNVAEIMRAKHPDIKLILCADNDANQTGIRKANEAASSVNGYVVMPDFGESKTATLTDFNDLHQLKGLEAVKLQLNAHNSHVSDYLSSAMPRYEDLDLDNVTECEFVLNDLIVAGVVLIGGSQGVGKTTQLVPLMTKVAHLCRDDDPLRPEARRKVIYVSEDIPQVRRILSSMKISGEFDGITQDEISTWFSLVEAKRLDAAEIVKLGDEYAKLATDHVDDGDPNLIHKVMPVVVFDTSAATIDLANENDNAEVSRALSQLKNNFVGLPVIIVAHLPKAQKGSNADAVSVRGANAWEGDCNQVIYLTKIDDGSDKRWLDISTPKHRFTTSFDGVEFSAVRHSIQGKSYFGKSKIVQLIHSTAEPISSDIRKTKEIEKKSNLKAGADFALVQDIKSTAIKLLADETNNGYFTKGELKTANGGNATTVSNAIDSMIADGVLVIFDVAKSNQRKTNHKNGLCLAIKTSAVNYHNLDG